MVSHNHVCVPDPPAGCDPVLGRVTVPAGRAPPLGVATPAGRVAVLAAPIVPVAVATAVLVVGVLVRRTVVTVVAVGDGVGVHGAPGQGVAVKVGVTGVAVFVDVTVVTTGGGRQVTWPFTAVTGTAVPAASTYEAVLAVEISSVYDPATSHLRITVANVKSVCGVPGDGRFVQPAE